MQTVRLIKIRVTLKNQLGPGEFADGMSETLRMSTSYWNPESDSGILDWEYTNHEGGWSANNPSDTCELVILSTEGDREEAVRKIKEVVNSWSAVEAEACEGIFDGSLVTQVPEKYTEDDYPDLELIERRYLESKKLKQQATQKPSSEGMGL